MNNSKLSRSHTRVFTYILLLCLPVIGFSQDYRSIDGTNNNEFKIFSGAVGDIQTRLTSAAYTDDIGQPITNRPNPRLLSNRLFAQSGNLSDPLNLSDFTWVFGQFIDHDITLVENGHEPMMIRVPEDDEVFAPGAVIPMLRNEVADGTGVSNARQYTNHITAYIDGSAIYGSDQERADWLRSFEGGKLKTSDGDLLPWNTKDNSFNGPIDYKAPFMADDTRSLAKFFVAGDIRANENPLLIAVHTLFVREHNRVCDLLVSQDPSLSDEELYQNARARVIATLQNIVYYEWLPAMGVDIANYTGYKPNVEATIFNEFSAAAFRLGHTLINSNIIRMDNAGNEIKSGNVSLRDAFFNPYVINLAGGIDPYFKGMATQTQQRFDCKVIDDVRNFLFGVPGAGGLDLAAININRGRDRGLLDFNGMRRELGLPQYDDFYELASSPEDAAAMESAYGSIDKLDAWVGMLAEKKPDDALFGTVVTKLMERQFQVLRDGDRFYFENNRFSEDELEQIKATTMSDLLARNTGITLMQKNVFEAMPHNNIEEGPDLIPFALDAIIYPNPVDDVMHMKMYSDKEENVDLKILDYQGKLVLSKTYHVYKGNNYINIPLKDCPRGYYNVYLENDRRFKVLKMVKR